MKPPSPTSQFLSLRPSLRQPLRTRHVHPILYVRALSTTIHLQHYARPYQCRPSPRRISHKFHRYASASSSPAVRRTTASSPIVCPARRTLPSPLLNPPSSIHPAPLVIAPRGANQGLASYLYNSGKSYIGFYKDGINRVRANHKLAKAVGAKLRASSSSSGPASATPGNKKNYQTPQTELTLPRVTRAEYQLVLRSYRDMLRLPGFAFLVLAMGEWLPLIAIWITPVVPVPCRIPGQIRRELEKLERRRQIRLQRLGRTYTAAELFGDADTDAEGVDVEKLPLPALLHFSAQLGCHSSVWDMLFLTPPAVLLRWSVGRRLRYLEKDDAMIRRDGGVKGLSGEEVRVACVERGIDTLGRKEEELRRELDSWFGEGGER